MASVFVLLEAFTRKEAAALGFFPCATASFLLKNKNTEGVLKSPFFEDMAVSWRYRRVLICYSSP